MRSLAGLQDFPAPAGGAVWPPGPRTPWRSAPRSPGFFLRLVLAAARARGHLREATAAPGCPEGNASPPGPTRLTVPGGSAPGLESRLCGWAPGERGVPVVCGAPGSPRPPRAPPRAAPSQARGSRCKASRAEADGRARTVGLHTSVPTWALLVTHLPAPDSGPALSLLPGRCLRPTPSQLARGAHRSSWGGSRFIRCPELAPRRHRLSISLVAAQGPLDLGGRRRQRSFALR